MSCQRCGEPIESPHPTLCPSCAHDVRVVSQSAAFSITRSTAAHHTPSIPLTPNQENHR